MKKSLIVGAALLLAAATACLAITPQEALQRVSWYGQSSLRIQLGGKIVWIDPVNVSASETADIILITHSHADHYSKSDIKKLSGPGTEVVASFEGAGLSRIMVGDSRTYGELVIEAVASYNIKKTSLHPKSAQFCGFVLSAEGVRIYAAGDTERIPEMKAIVCDIAFLPLGQTYTMGSVDEAVQSALDVGAKIAVPYHYGLYEGTSKDADAFCSALAAKGVTALRLSKK